MTNLNGDPGRAIDAGSYIKIIYSDPISPGPPLPVTITCAGQDPESRSLCATSVPFTIDWKISGTHNNILTLTFQFDMTWSTPANSTTTEIYVNVSVDTRRHRECSGVSARVLAGPAPVYPLTITPNHGPYPVGIAACEEDWVGRNSK
jgi:hypothetical protein